ncbi:hypothetical protein BKA70DRAFT_1525985 [Coprinopsis sp. MPI-PUGE-AT-0042]|nr:hypothetical protein BKA70DRAFT_1525985 [Coprinopsis sp. MPI-PUGE-AT-0042]
MHTNSENESKPPRPLSQFLLFRSSVYQMVEEVANHNRNISTSCNQSAFVETRPSLRCIVEEGIIPGYVIEGFSKEAEAQGKPTDSLEWLLEGLKAGYPDPKLFSITVEVWWKLLSSEDQERWREEAHTAREARGKMHPGYVFRVGPSGGLKAFHEMRNYIVRSGPPKGRNFDESPMRPDVPNGSTTFVEPVDHNPDTLELYGYNSTAFPEFSGSHTTPVRQNSEQATIFEGPLPGIRAIEPPHDYELYQSRRTGYDSKIIAMLDTASGFRPSEVSYFH